MKCHCCRKPARAKPSKPYWQDIQNAKTEQGLGGGQRAGATGSVSCALPCSCTGSYTTLLLQEAGKSKAFQALLADIEKAETEGGALDKACSELQALISDLKVPANLAKETGTD